MNLIIFTKTFKNNGNTNFTNENHSCYRDWISTGGEIYAVRNLTDDQIEKFNSNSNNGESFPHLTFLFECIQVTNDNFKEIIVNFQLVEDSVIDSHENVIQLTWNNHKNCWCANREIHNYEGNCRVLRKEINRKVENWILMLHGETKDYTAEYYDETGLCLKI